MAGTLHAVDYLARAEKFSPRPVCVLSGDDPFLKRQVLLRLRQEVLGGGEGDLSLSVFDGQTATLRDVLDELAVVPMFGIGKRLAVVEQADAFVSRYRSELEDYVVRPRSTGVLVLDVTSWPANTRLYKTVADQGLRIDCAAPSSARLIPWLTSWARQVHQIQMSRSSAEILVELVGPQLGVLDQELAKLALAAGSDGRITPEHVVQSTGTWRVKTTWEMLDAVLDGKAGDGLMQLDRLLLAGENPVGVLSQISGWLRRLAAATRLVLQTEASGRPMRIREALERAGFKRFLLGKAERQLRRLGRHRGDRLYHWILQADLDMKGQSALPPRLILERLILRLAATAPRGRGLRAEALMLQRRVE